MTRAVLRERSSATARRACARVYHVTTAPVFTKSMI
jgi:hypothetical protein